MNTPIQFLVEQQFEYDYPEPITELRHRLVVIPPARFGDQVLREHSVGVSDPSAVVEDGFDRFGNAVVEIYAPQVASRIVFSARMIVERQPDEVHRVPDGWLSDAYLLQPTPLTAPHPAIVEAARSLRRGAATPLELADQVNDWVYQHMTYQHDSTGVRTPAGAALAGGRGVCQDYSHIMIAICRTLGIPARYVSGHLVGEGGTHAWVEVILPAGDGSGDGIVWVFDPTHAARGGPNHLTIAVGADYDDVAPTSGTYRAGMPGRLSAHKRVTVTAAV